MKKKKEHIITEETMDKCKICGRKVIGVHARTLNNECYCSFNCLEKEFEIKKNGMEPMRKRIQASQGQSA